MLRIASILLALATIAVPRSARAFCGFYVATGDHKMVNEATQVVLMRNGTRTVLSMQNNYKGPAEAFAMVVPVPTVLGEHDVKTLAPSVFDEIERMGSPRLVEYWEQDPCRPDQDESGGTGTAMALDEGKMGKPGGRGADLGVRIEAQFAVGEYQIVILSAKDSTGLGTWLRQEHYNIPARAEQGLRPYVESGSKFFVAKVDPAKVKFVDGRAVLSPLRFFYDSDDFSLPIRLGLANSDGTQDLIVNILAPEQRYEVANYPNITIPTNITVKDGVREHFAEFYAALFDATLAKNPGAIVTEYAWQATSCDPCPGPVLDRAILTTLGADVLTGAASSPVPYTATDFVLTRLHARYGATIDRDLVFSAGGPIVGGREERNAGQLEAGWRAASNNNFQARYVIRHAWTGPIACKDPVRGVWGAKDGGAADWQPPSRIASRASPPESRGLTPALHLASANRGSLRLASAVADDVPELGLHKQSGALMMTDVTATRSPAKSGCGCGAGDPGGAVAIGSVVLALARRRRGTGFSTSPPSSSDPDRT